MLKVFPASNLTSSVEKYWWPRIRVEGLPLEMYLAHDNDGEYAR